MRIIGLFVVALLALTNSASAQTQFVLRDASNNVIALSSEPLSATTGTVAVSDVIAPVEARQPMALTDAHGRCLWRISGSTVVPGAPRWPATAALKRAAAARLRRRIDETLADIIALERWQADPNNVAVVDRAAELTAANNRLVQLRDVLAGQ